MFSQYFGNYLLNRGLLTSEQLSKALEMYHSTHVKLGVIAVDRGYLTSVQVEEIHDLQRQKDMMFGQIAISLNYLTSEQVEDMLSSQKSNHLQLAQAIVNEGYMTIDEFSIALNDYKNKYSLSEDRFEAIKNGNIDAIVQTLLLEECSVGQKYTNYVTLFVKNLVRFIDTNIFIEVAPCTVVSKNEWVVRQQIFGYKNMDTYLLADEAVFLKIASKFAEEELTQVDELAQASVSEFMNLHNGIYIVNMSNRGIELNMEPQQVLQGKGITSYNGAALKVIIHTSFGQFNLVICDDLHNLKLN